MGGGPRRARRGARDAARLEEELSRSASSEAPPRRVTNALPQRAAELDGAVAAEQRAIRELEQSRARAEARVSELQAELTDVRAELEEHQLTDERVAAVLAERDEALATAARLEEELLREREQGGDLRVESERAAQRAAEVDGAVAAAQARSDELEQSRARGEARVSELQAELTNVRAELEEHQLTDERVAAVLAERDEALANSGAAGGGAVEGARAGGDLRVESRTCCRSVPPRSMELFAAAQARSRTSSSSRVLAARPVSVSCKPS